MENLKIDVRKHNWSDAFDLFVELGAKHKADKGEFGLVSSFLYLHGGIIWAAVNDNDVGECKEVTIHQLKDMVILKRNDVGDATHYHVHYGAKFPYLFLSGNWYFFGGDKWNESSHSDDFYSRLVAKKPQVEYLIKVAGEYTLVVGDYVPDGGIEVPDGADTATQYEDYFIFWRGDIESFSKLDGDKDWVSGDDNIPLSEYLTHFGNSIVWQRHTQDENEVSDTDTELLNRFDDLPEVEKTLKERQSQYGCYEDVAYATQSMIDILCNNTGYKSMSKPHKESIHMILSKIARLSCGDQNHKDSWHDISGYAQLIEKII